MCFRLIKTRTDYLDFDFQTGVQTVARGGRSTGLKMKQKLLLPCPRQGDPTCTNSAEQETHPAPKWMRNFLGSLRWCHALCVTKSQVICWMHVWGTAQLPATQDSLCPTLSEQRGQSEGIFFCLIFYSSCCCLPSVWCQREDLIFTVIWQGGDVPL